MSELKYIIIEATAKNGTKVQMPVLFGHYISHKDMAEYVRPMLWRGQFHLQDEKIVGAGFVDLANAAVRGYSESLDIKSKSVDAEVINAFRMNWAL